jgi:hypothetical protein
VLDHQLGREEEGELQEAEEEDEDGEERDEELDVDGTAGVVS